MAVFLPVKNRMGMDPDSCRKLLLKTTGGAERIAGASPALDRCYVHGNITSGLIN